VVDGFAEWVEPQLSEAQPVERKSDAQSTLSRPAPAPA
jgi:hypothetical protein